MTSTPTNQPTTSQTSPGWPMSPLEYFDRLLSAAPRKLDQPINPNWTFGNLISVTEQNSTAPDTERNIVAVHSYGRQLGRIIDAVMELVAELPTSKRQNPAFEQLAELEDKIETIKSRSAARRLDRFAADLVELRKTDEAEYRRVTDKLRTILGAADS